MIVRSLESTAPVSHLYFRIIAILLLLYRSGLILLNWSTFVRWGVLTSSSCFWSALLILSLGLYAFLRLVFPGPRTPAFCPLSYFMPPSSRIRRQRRFRRGFCRPWSRGGDLRPPSVGLLRASRLCRGLPRWPFAKVLIFSSDPAPSFIYLLLVSGRRSAASLVPICWCLLTASAVLSQILIWCCWLIPVFACI